MARVARSAKAKNPMSQNANMENFSRSKALNSTSFAAKRSPSSSQVGMKGSTNDENARQSRLGKSTTPSGPKSRNYKKAK